MTEETSAAEQRANITEIYGHLPDIPVLEAAEGIRFDFNYGLRVRFPKEGGPWRVIFYDLDTANLLYNQVIQPDMQVVSLKKFFVRFGLRIFHEGELDKPIFEHDFDLTGKTVMVQMPVPTVGDTFGWFPYVEKFRLQNKCHVVAVLEPQFIELFKDTYPEIEFTTRDKVCDYQPYACYYVGLFFEGDTDHQPYDFRMVGNHRTAGYILGVDPTEERPRLDLSAPRQIQEPYVCIAAQASTHAKYWNNPDGWYQVVKFLKESGYRVICVDKERVHGTGVVFNHIPYGCEDMTGPFPLQERINIIKDADFFVGLSSGLSWVAWACGTPVVMISGFSNAMNEFQTPYRVINFHGCHGCWNDMRENFDHFDFLWCPRKKEFECSKMITGEQVIRTIRSIPEFQKRMAGHDDSNA